MKPEEKTPEKCKTCPYALGYVHTLVNPCPKCVGENSIFGEHPPMPLTAGKFSGKCNVSIK